ncbi:MAG TPA: hypothetical protein VKU41_09890 [Polyangiaceae bacterium]|nr:hypothetical protein [Polyangiaceae bacterium]
MRPRATSPLLRLIVACLAVALAAGSGLPGLVRALSGISSHVCTCAMGGSHASCPVCSRALSNGRAISEDPVGGEPQADGVPCGDKRVAVGVAVEPGVLPAGLVGIVPAGEVLPVPRAECPSPPAPFIEPATPPPRTATV